ncbi:MAG TPA: HNH endonuclease [Patescibacteria group bacterium]|nr:HNH endonuclease [Patescibacteria group bacterium]
MDKLLLRIKRLLQYFAVSFAAIELWYLASDPPVNPNILRIQLTVSAIYALTAMGLMLCVRFYIDYKKQQRQLSAKMAEEDLARRHEAHAQEKQQEAQRREKLKAQYGNLDVDEIVFHGALNAVDKRFLLTDIHKFSWSEAEGLLKISEDGLQKTKLQHVIGKIIKKADQMYGDIPSDDARSPIPDNVRMLVWQRDGGKCIVCGAQENLVFDHITPVAKGGSTAEINIQLLCERCHREKREP